MRLSDIVRTKFEDLLGILEEVESWDNDRKEREIGSILWRMNKNVLHRSLTLLSIREMIVLIEVLERRK